MPTLPRFLVATVILLMAAACGDSDGNINTSPCDTANPPASCGETCQSNSECGDGLYCADNGECTADCTAGDPQSCGSGELCTQNGQCIPDPNAGGDGGMDCPSVVVNLESVTPTVVLLIDQSGSMAENFGDGLDRWEAAQETLGADDGIVAQLESSVRFGAVLYTARGTVENPDPQCPRLETANPDDDDPDSPELAPKLNNHDAIQDLLFDSDPVEDTPTGISLRRTATQLAALAPADPDNPEPKIIVLATDGLPDTCETPDPQTEEAEDDSIAAAQEAYDMGIRTIVLGISDDIPDDHLQELANAGAGQPLDGDEVFYTADNPGELVSSFEAIIGGVAKSCQLNLDGNIAPGYESSGDVRIDGDQLDFGTDWDVVDSNTIELIGDACTRYLDDPNAVLSAEFPCGTIVDPE